MIGSANENERVLDNVAGIRERSQSGGGPKSGRRAVEANQEYEHEYEYECEHE